MTTLPQTTALRLPRNSPGMQLSTPVSAPSMMSQPVSAPQMTGTDAWRVIRNNLWLIFLLTGFAATSGYFLNGWLLKNHPKYCATGVLVVGRSMGFDPIHGQQALDLQTLGLEVRNNVQLLKNPALFSEVLQDTDSPIRQTAWFKQFPTPSDQKADLADNLSVVPSADTNLIQVTMSARDGSDCEKIIQAVVDQQMKDEERDNEEVERKQSEELTQLKARLEVQRSDFVDEINDKQMKLNISGPVSSGAGRLNVKDQQMSELTGRQIDADLRLDAAQQRYDELVNMSKNNIEAPDVAEGVSRDPEVMRFSDILAQLQLRGLMMTSDGYSTQTAQLAQQEALIQQKLTQAQNDARTRMQASLVDDARRELETAKNASGRIKDQIQSLDEEIADLNKTLGDYLTDEDQLKVVNDKLKEYSDKLEQNADDINQKDMSSVAWKSLPEAQDQPTFPKLTATMALAITLGLFLSLGIAFTRELLDTSVRSPRDISRIGHMSMLGIVPHEDDDPQAQGARLPLVIFEAPQSMMAEQLRQVRTRLQHAASLDTTRSILITSPSPNDGKSTIAANLASGLALNGRRILLVDANFRRPSLHRTFNLGNDVGFSDVLNSIDTFESAVQETQVPNLYVLPSGLKPTNATELLESQLLVDFIERALEEFDHVIFDSGPLLFVSETVALAPRVDGVVTVVRARTNSRGVLQRMRDSLRQIKAEHLGVVLNAVRSQGGGYYRSNIRAYYDYQKGGRAA